MARRFAMKNGFSWLVLVMLVALSTTLAADTKGPVLHEYLPPDAGESADLSRTDATGVFPEAVRTKSGPITPPDMRTSPLPSRVYHKPNSPTSAFRPDRDTRRPNIEQYDDPFSPAMTPFKRMHAYDAVREDYSLYVRNTELHEVEVGGDANEDDDRFFGDMMIALRAGEPVRIPTVGPGARLIRVMASPETKDLKILRDGAENWFAKSDTAGRVRLVTELAIDRDAFASEYPDIGWSELPSVPAQPSSHRDSFNQVKKAIGISRDQTPRQVVTKMVAYFRSFAPSTESPQGEGDIYLDLALSKKGVCRHRAFAFLVTALNIGVPARLIHNEAHAWVEVRDHRMWHRIDLGGAALDLEQDHRLDRPPHVPPPDSFEWPTGRDSGADLAHRDRAEAVEQQGDPDQNGGVVDPLAPGEPDPNAPNPAKDMPETTLKIEEVDRDIFRGLPVKIRGNAVSEGQPCPHLRVDVFLLMDGGNTKRRLGSLSTDENGEYAGEVVMPTNVPIGDHELVVATPGANKCGPGQAR